MCWLFTSGSAFVTAKYVAIYWKIKHTVYSEKMYFYISKQCINSPALYATQTFFLQAAQSIVIAYVVSLLIIEESFPKSGLFLCEITFWGIKHYITLVCQ